MELRPCASKALRSVAFSLRGVRSYLTTDTVYNRSSAARPGGLKAPGLAAPPMFVYTIYCEATTHSALLETGIRKIKTGHRDVNNRISPPRVELRPAASKVFSRSSLHKRSLAFTHSLCALLRKYRPNLEISSKFYEQSYFFDGSSERSEREKISTRKQTYQTEIINTAATFGANMTYQTELINGDRKVGAKVTKRFGNCTPPLIE